MLAVSAGLLLVLAWSYAGKRLGVTAVVWWVFMAASVWCLVAVLWPVAPVTCAVLLVLFAGVPVLCHTVILYDMVVGAFPLDTFFGLVPVIVVPPVFLVLNGVLVAVL
jgi:hypothetical protein